MNGKRLRTWAGALTTIALLACAAGPASAQLEKGAVAVTTHSSKFNGEGLRYTATVSEVFLKDAAGEKAASITTIAYVRDGVADTARRPVLFLFNGGPGASSSPLHMEALGPVRRIDPKSATAGVTDNAFSPLDAADLVFIDPVGTGFSRVLAGHDGKPWFNVKGDALAVKAVIADWLKANHREASPRYLVGESYGTTRAAVIAANSADLLFDGVMLVAVTADVSGREMPYVASLPTMAAGAWYHQTIKRAGRTVDQVYAEALQFARTEYVAALIRGASLPAAEKHRVATRMSALIGLPVGLIEASNLRISKNDWMFNVLKDKTLRTGLLDVRITGPLESGQDGAIDDPALGVVPKRATGSPSGPPPSPASIGPVESPAVGAYLAQTLNYPGDGKYYGVNFTVNSQWDIAGMRESMQGLAEAMKAQPKLRLFWCGGYYDLTTPAYAAAYTFDQVGIPPNRVTAALFAGPHGVYAGEDNLSRFSAAVRGFVTK